MSGHLHVLVVEDDAEIRAMVTETLEEAGYRTVQTADGAQAITSLIEEQPLAIILDMGLPFIDGQEVGRVSRQLYGGDVPIVVISANGHAEADARALGASGFLAKPFDIDELVAVVRRALRGREALTQSQRDINDRRFLDRDSLRERRGVLRRETDSAGK